jgi:hypothetical protein
MQTTTIVAIATMLLGSGGIFQFLLNRHDKKVEAERVKAELDSAKLEALVNLTCADMQDRLVRHIDRIIKRYNRNGTGVSLKEKATIKEMYFYYEALGWNHLAKEAMAELEEIPVTE